VSASVLLSFGREVPLAEWEAVANDADLLYSAGVFPSNVWKLASADVEVRWGWPSEEEARQRRAPASASGAQVSSYKDSDLPANARVVALLEEKLSAVPEIVPEALREYLEKARADG
jgi:hypothetical protein